MFTHRPVVSAAIARRTALFNSAVTRLIASIALAGLLAGCTAARTAPVAAADPADPDVPVRAARYSPVLSGYTSQRPVGPKPWREQNERVAPKGEAQ